MPLRNDDPRAFYSPVTLEDGGSAAIELVTDPDKMGTLVFPSRAYWEVEILGTDSKAKVLLWFWPPKTKLDASKLTLPKAGEFRPDPFQAWDETQDPNNFKAVGIVKSAARPFTILCPGKDFVLGMRFYGTSSEPVAYLRRVMAE
jgi:hypothetical protein